MTARRRNRAQALIPVLFVVLILTAFVVSTTTSSRRNSRAAEANYRDMQRYLIARGAVQYAMASLQAQTNGGSVTAQLTQPPDTDSNGWTALGEGWYKVEVVDTTSRLNVNTASADTILRSLPNVDGRDELVANIINWRDSDDTGPVSISEKGVARQVEGVETDYYQGLQVPYSAKNAPLDTVDELLLIKGMTTELLYGPREQQDDAGASSRGSGATRSTRSRQGGGGGDPAPVEQAESPGQTVALCELFTTYTKELNVQADGSKRVNILTASAQDLQDKAGLTSQLAQRLVQARAGTGTNAIKSIADLLNVTGFTRQIMQESGDKFTVTNDQFRTNVVNINTAPREVLAALTGVDQATYDAVIQARESGTVFSGMNDLFQLTDLNRQQLQALVDQVCTKSSAFLVRVWVRMATGRPMVVQALVEVSPPEDPTAQTAGAPAAMPPRLLQWKEMARRPGWSSWNRTTALGNSGGTFGN